MYKIFNKEQQEKANFIMKNEFAKFSELSSKEIRELAVIWSYYSGKIEGNTYTYIETDTLLKEGITSPKKYEDAKMLKNLYNTFILVLKEIKNSNYFSINSQTLMEIHSELTSGLVENRERGKLRNRPVRITGTAYTPLSNEVDIKNELSTIFDEHVQYSNPLEQAIYLHCNIARLQPFIDGNKRTSRLIESIIMLQSNIIPTYSTKDVDILNYRKGLLHFYETKDYSQYVDYSLNKQIREIEKLSETKYKQKEISKANAPKGSEPEL